MSRSHRARAVRPAESPAEDLRATHDAWTRDLRDRLPHDSDSSDGDTPPRARATRHRSPTRDARREPRHRSPARAAPEEQPVATGALERQLAGLTAAVKVLVEQQAAQLREQRRLQADMVQMLARRQSVAVGEAVPDAPVAAPSSMGVWNGAGAHANTMPRLPEEMACEDGLLSWTEENVGELFACIAYKHLTSVDDATDNEEAGTQAQEIKVAARNEGIDGRALLHLTIEDMEKIGETAGVVAGGGECALTQVGHRISILNSLVAFRDAHAHEPWETVKELPLIKSQGLERKKGVAKLTEQLCKSFGVDQIRGDNSDEALRAATVHKSSKPKAPNATEVVVPVFATLIVKKIIEDTDGKLSLVGTFIQRPLIYDLASFARASGKETLPYFEMRINEGEAQSEDCFDVRKVARDMNGGREAEAVRETGYFTTATANFVTTLPLKLNTVFGEPPFKIVSATILSEMTGFLGKNDENERFELRPSFVAHASDLRTLCSVRDWKDDYKMDESSSWNFVTIMPTIEYEYDGGNRGKALYVPKLRVTFYLYKMATGKFIAILMPIVFAFAANTYNILRCFKQEGTDFADYLANNVALGLAVTFVVPYLLEEAESLTVYYYIIWIFGSFVLSLTAYFWHEPLAPNGRGPKRSQITWAHFVIIFQWASLIIPFYNGIQYRRRFTKIRSNWKQKRDLRMTFLGRPGEISDWEQKHVKMKGTKGSMNVIDPNLRTFVVKTGDDPRRPRIRLNPDILGRAAMDTTYAEAGPARKGRCEPWQFDAKNHYIYCGLHRNYYQDKDVAKAIDHDEHNVPFLRKKNHEPIG